MTGEQAPSREGAVVLAKGDRDPLRPWLGLTVVGTLAVLLAPGNPWPVHIGGAVAMALLFGTVPALWWRAGRRRILLTATHVMSARGDRVEKWAPLSEVQRLTFECTTPAAWTPQGNWTSVVVHPPSAVHPQGTFAGGFGQVVIEVGLSKQVAQLCAATCRERGIDVVVIPGRWSERQEARREER